MMYDGNTCERIFILTLYTTMNTMQDLQSTLFSPIGKEYCFYFYSLMVISLFFLVVNILGLVWVATTIKSKRKHLFRETMSVVIPGFIIYFQNRLLYSMCVNR